MRIMSICGSVMGIIISAGITYFTGFTLPGVNRYTVIIGLPYVYFIIIIILSAIALNKKNIPRVFSEVKND